MKTVAKMGRKKKSFIDKKKAHRFSLVHRSQTDPLYHDEEFGSKVVLHPQNARTARAVKFMGINYPLDSVEDPEVEGGSENGSLAGQSVVSVVDTVVSVSTVGSRVFKEVREVDELGLPIDGYDYNRHVTCVDRETLGNGDNLPRDSSRDPAIGRPLATVKEEEEEEIDDGVEYFEWKNQNNADLEAAKKLSQFSLPQRMFASEVHHDRMFEAITLNPQHMDKETRALLEEEDIGSSDDDEGILEGVGTLEDNFMEQLLEAEEEHTECEIQQSEKRDSAEFNFEAHMSRIIAEAEENDQELEGCLSDADSYTDQVLDRIASERTETDIDRHLDYILESEYNFDEVGELESSKYDSRVGGDIEPSHEHMQQIIADFYETKSNAKKAAGANEENREFRESQLAWAMSKLKIVQANTTKSKSHSDSDQTDEASKCKDGDNLDASAFKEEDDDDAQSTISVDVSPEEVLMQLGYEDKVKERWDAETIVSTYSVLDNHPSKIHVPGKQKRKLLKSATARGGKEMTKAVDHCSIDTNTDDANVSGYEEAGNRIATSALTEIITRDRLEDSDEKRARKQLVKNQQRLRRQQKKDTKMLFKNERTVQKRKDMSLRNAAAPLSGTSTFKL